MSTTNTMKSVFEGVLLSRIGEEALRSGADTAVVRLDELFLPDKAVFKPILVSPSQRPTTARYGTANPSISKRFGTRCLRTCVPACRLRPYRGRMVAGVWNGVFRVFSNRVTILYCSHDSVGAKLMTRYSISNTLVRQRYYGR